jgi:hypothetical protein
LTSIWRLIPLAELILKWIIFKFFNANGRRLNETTVGISDFQYVIMFLRLEASCQSKKGLKRKCFSIFAKIQNFAKFRFRENSKHFHFHDNYLTLYFLYLYLSKRTLSGTDRLNLVLYETVRLTTWEQESKRLLCRSNYSCTGLRILRYIYILFVPIYSWNPVANHDACYRASILATNHVSLLFPRQPIMMLVRASILAWPPITWAYCSPASQS